MRIFNSDDGNNPLERGKPRISSQQFNDAAQKARTPKPETLDDGGPSAEDTGIFASPLAPTEKSERILRIDQSHKPQPSAETKNPKPKMNRREALANLAGLTVFGTTSIGANKFGTAAVAHRRELRRKEFLQALNNPPKPSKATPYEEKQSEIKVPEYVLSDPSDKIARWGLTAIGPVAGTGLGLAAREMIAGSDANSEPTKPVDNQKSQKAA